MAKHHSSTLIVDTTKLTQLPIMNSINGQFVVSEFECPHCKKNATLFGTFKRKLELTGECMYCKKPIHINATSIRWSVELKVSNLNTLRVRKA